ncbi:TPA: hypothetical protein ACJ509_004017 [Stenotrophomonas maltophilia]
MASMTEITCACGCGRKKLVRTADVQRGWGKFATKSCKAQKQTRDQLRKGGFRGSGVTYETYMYYAQEYGGHPQFSRNGKYIGFTGGGFDQD